MIPHRLNPFRLKRIADIALEQCRALRILVFIIFLQKNPATGAYVAIGVAANSTIEQFAKGQETFVKKLLRENWLSADDAK